MEWLITTKADANLEELEAKLAEWGCERTGLPPIPLDDDEQVIEVSGPADLPRKVKGEGPIIKVSPSSPMTLYLAPASETYARRLLCDQGSTVPEPSPAH